MALEWIASCRMTRDANRETVKATPTLTASSDGSERASSMSLRATEYLRCRSTVRVLWLRKEALQIRRFTQGVVSSPFAHSAWRDRAGQRLPRSRKKRNCARRRLAAPDAHFSSHVRPMFIVCARLPGGRAPR